MMVDDVRQMLFKAPLLGWNSGSDAVNPITWRRRHAAAGFLNRVMGWLSVRFSVISES